MLTVAILFEDDKPVRAFKDNKCIYNAYKWAHHHYCLSDYNNDIKLHQLPDWLKIKFYVMTEEQFQKLVK